MHPAQEPQWAFLLPAALYCYSSSCNTLLFSVIQLGQVSAHFLRDNSYTPYFKLSFKKQRPRNLFSSYQIIFNDFSFKSLSLLPTTAPPTRSVILPFSSNLMPK